MATPKIIIQKASAFQLKPQNSYLIHVPNIEPEATEALQQWLKDQGIDKAVIVSVEEMQISEVDKFLGKQA